MKSKKVDVLGKINSFYNRIIKRVFDIIGSFILLIVLSPLFVFLIIVGSIKMKGNPFFVQKRPGIIDQKTGNEKIFNLIKFRTMSNEKDKEGNLLPDKKRLNRYGRFLRSSSLDEISELINILIGNMSFVGPRPLLVKYLPLYSQEQRKRHLVKPGLTGYAQVHGRNQADWNERFSMDLYYVNNISFGLDIRILFYTVKVVLKKVNIDSSNTTEVTMLEFEGNTK